MSVSFSTWRYTRTPASNAGVKSKSLAVRLSLAGGPYRLKDYPEGVSNVT